MAASQIRSEHASLDAPQRLLRRMRLFTIAAVALAAAAGVAGIGLRLAPGGADAWLALLLSLLAASALLAWSAMGFVKLRLHAPLERVVRWAAEIRQGNLSARIPPARPDDLSAPVDDINRAAEWLEALARDKEFEFESQIDNLLPRMQERARIAHELHDSLAQTLAGLRLRVRVLDDTLLEGDDSAVWAEMERVESALEEANLELRELIGHFRAPLHKGGLVPSIRAAVSRFRKETRAETFIQDQWGEIDLPEEHEVHVLRIVQEALANVRKHGDAHNVRVMLTRARGVYCMLIEDDGRGFDEDAANHGPPGHFGISIMRERAAVIGAHLRIESEPGDGARVLLEFGADAPSSVAGAAS